MCVSGIILLPPDVRSCRNAWETALVHLAVPADDVLENARSKKQDVCHRRPDDQLLEGWRDGRIRDPFNFRSHCGKVFWMATMRAR